MMKRVLSVAIAAVLLFGLFCAFPVAANATSGMAISQECTDTIKRMEGFYAIPYWDYSQWTVGFGTTCPAEDLERYQKEGIPMDEANALMDAQLKKFADSVNDFLDRTGLTFTQGQFDALTSMTYNLGSAMLYNESNRIYRAIVDGKTGNDLIFDFSVYCTAGGEFLPGLMRRRLVEANMYINGEYDDYAPENYCYVLYDPNGGVRDVRAQGYDCNLEARPMSVPTYSGYKFLGWYTQASGGVKVTELNESHDGMTLYAHWEKGDSQSGTALPNGDLEVTVTENVVNVRSGPGIDYAIMSGAFRGDKLVVTALATVDGKRWGKCNAGWIPLSYTNYGELTGDYGDAAGDTENMLPVEVPVRATVLSSGGITLYNGPHTTYPKVGTLEQGKEIEIVEVCTVFDTQWGRCSEGWVQLNLKLQLHDAQSLAHSFMATVTNSYLNVRSGPGTNYSRTASLSKGESIQIVAIVFAEGTYWGRYEKGWVSLDYTDFDISRLGEYMQHHYGDWYVSKQSTCVTTGQERRDCAYCDDYQTRELAQGEHIFGDWTDSKPANCVTEGEQTRMCTVCGALETRKVGMSDHVYGEWYETEAGTCSTATKERRDCVNCELFETREIAAGGHGFGDWELVQAPNCTAAGLEQRQCAYCDKIEERPIDQLAHNYDAWVEYWSATCTTEGEQRRYCLSCGNLDSAVLPMTDHKYGQWYETVVPTAETLGEERRDCVNCEHFEVRELGTTEHVFDAWVVVTEATCTEPGQEQRSCTHCELVETRQTAAKGHAMGMWYEAEAPGCDKNGVERKDCENCDYHITVVLPAFGHTYSNWFMLKEANCTEVGQRARLCEVCMELETEDIPAVSHQYSDWFVLEKPTCTSDGERVRGCATCGAMEMESLSAKGHNYGEWYTVIQAACGQPGQERRDCATCGEMETRELMAKDHSFGQWYVYREASCGVACEMRRDCSVCGYYESEILAAMEHQMGNWVVAKEASCGAEGLLRRTCSRCGYAEEQTVPALKHNFGQWYVAVEPTSTSYGQERRDCANCGDYETRQIDKLVGMVTRVYGTVYGNYYVNVRAGTGTGYTLLRKLFYGSRVEILEHVTVDSSVWGRIGEGEWILITNHVSLETVEEPESQEITKTYATVTCDVLNVRVGAGSHYSAVAYLINGNVVEVLEQTTIGDSVWGRIANGWICLSGYTRLHTETTTVSGGKPVNIIVMGTVTASSINLRSAPGTSNTKLGVVTQNSVYQIYEMTMVGTTVWGKIDQGWIRLDGYVSLEMIREETQEPKPPEHTHTFGDWYVVHQPTCSAAGTERRDCTTCDQTETRQIASTAHIYSAWKVLAPPTCTAEGKQQRCCDICGDAQNEVIQALGHSFGTWYEIKAATFTSEGQERRDCTVCNYTETRKIDKLGDQVPYRTYGTVIADSMNVRSGPGTSYTKVGTMVKGEQVEIYEMTRDGNNWLWGRTDKGWIRLDTYVDMWVVATGADQPNAKVYATVTVNAVNIRSGPGSSYTHLGTLYKGMKVEVLDQKCLSNGAIWIKIGENAWTCFTEYMTMETEIVTDAVKPTTKVVNVSSMNIRDAAGYDTNVIGVLYKGAVVKVYKTIMVGTTEWALTDFGWLKASCLS